MDVSQPQSGIISLAGMRRLGEGAPGHCVPTWALLQVRYPQLQLFNANKTKGTQIRTPGPVPTCPGSGAGRANTHFKRPRIKAWNFCLVLLRGASPATCQHRECRERVLGPVGCRAQTVTAQGTHPPSPGYNRAPGTWRCPQPHPHLSSQRLPPHSRGNFSAGL